MVQVVQQAMTRPRRRPTFPVGGVMKPFGLYPLMATYVAPAETLQSFTLKWRLVSKPIVNPLVGAWAQVWLVYVKLSDMDPALTAQFIANDVDNTAYLQGSANQRYFTAGGQISWIPMAIEHFHDTFFLDEDETAKTIDNVRKTKLNNRTWLENLMFRPDESTVDTSDPWDLQEQIRAFRAQQMLDLKAVTYSDILEQYGVTDLSGVDRRPEILRYSTSWQTPVNTIDPATGNPSSAWIWSDEMKLTEAKRFKEPGFLVLCATVRPKMGLRYHKHSLIGNMWGFDDFFPLHEQRDVASQVKVINTDDNVFASSANGADPTDELWYDRSDLLANGEQFFNAYAASTDWPYEPYWSTAPDLQSTAALQDMRGEYATDTDIDAIFSGSSDNDKFLWYDGIVMATISGHTQNVVPR